MPLPGHKPLNLGGNPHDLGSWLDTVLLPEGGLRPDALEAAQAVLQEQMFNQFREENPDFDENVTAPVGVTFEPGSGSNANRLTAIEKFLSEVAGERPQAEAPAEDHAPADSDQEGEVGQVEHVTGGEDDDVEVDSVTLNNQNSQE